MRRGLLLLTSALTLAAVPAGADPLGLVDYDALMAARAEQTFCTGGRLCTVILPGGFSVQQDGTGAWLAGGTELTAGSFALGYALTLAIYDLCDRLPDGIDRAIFEAAVAEMKTIYRLSVEFDGFGQSPLALGAVDDAFEGLRRSLAGYVARDPDLSRCQIPAQLETLLVELAQESYWQAELMRLRDMPTLPTANFTIE